MHENRDHSIIIRVDKRYTKYTLTLKTRKNTLDNTDKEGLFNKDYVVELKHNVDGRLEMKDLDQENDLVHLIAIREFVGILNFFGLEIQTYLDDFANFFNKNVSSTAPGFIEEEISFDIPTYDRKTTSSFTQENLPSSDLELVREEEAPHED